jgi:L-asparagine oxygenase
MEPLKKTPTNSVLELNEEEINVLKNLAFTIKTIPSQNSLLFCEEAKTASSFIPERIKTILLNFAQYGSETGYLLFKNFEINSEALPKTPKNNKYNIGEKEELSKIQAILVSAIGHLLGYEAECFGNLFQDIVPNKSMANNQTSLGSNIELEIHTEQAFSNLKPDILCLSCLKGDDNANTYILPIQSILKNTTEKERALLRLPLWKTGVDLSFKLNNNEFIEGDIRGPMSIINGEEIDPTLIFDQDLMTGITEEAQCFIKKIVSIYYEYRISHNLKKGEIILIDNKRAVHGRSPFFPKYNGHDRFLVRCFAVFDLNRTKYARPNNDRVISAIYS